MKEIYSRAVQILENGWSRSFYASKIVDGEEIPAHVYSQEATNFCLMGAVEGAAIEKEQSPNIKSLSPYINHFLYLFYRKCKNSSVIDVNNSFRDGSDAVEFMRKLYEGSI